MVQAARVDAAVDAIDGFDTRLGGDADEGVIIRVPRASIDDFTRGAASKEPLGA